MANGVVLKGYFSDYIDHPNATLRPGMFWEYDLENFDFQENIQVVVQRVIERGGTPDFYALLNLYGPERVIATIKVLPYLGEKNINFVSTIFDIPLNSLLCYQKMPSRERSWNY